MTPVVVAALPTPIFPTRHDYVAVGQDAARVAGRGLWSATHKVGRLVQTAIIKNVWPHLKRRSEWQPQRSTSFHHLRLAAARVAASIFQVFAVVFLFALCYAIVASWKDVQTQQRPGPIPPIAVAPQLPPVPQLSPLDQAVYSFHGPHQSFPSVERARAALTHALGLPTTSDDAAISAALNLAEAHVASMSAYRAAFPLHRHVSRRLLAVLVPDDVALLSNAITNANPLVGPQLTGYLADRAGSFTMTFVQQRSSLGSCAVGNLSIKRASFQHDERLLVCLTRQRWQSFSPTY